MTTNVCVYVEDDEPFVIDLDSFLADNADGLDATEVRFAIASNDIFIGGGGAAPVYCVHRACAQ